MELIQAKHAVIGENLTINRAIPTTQKRLVGAWCFLDQAGPANFAAGEGLHVAPHPHIGLQTFTWMMEGELLHRDSLGSEQLIRPGQVNLMTAGRGIVHTEDTVQDGATVHAAQLWIALPDAQRYGDPTFEHYPDLPSRDAQGFHQTLLVGSFDGMQSPVRVYSPLLGVDLLATEDAAANWQLNPTFEHAVLVLQGQAEINGETVTPGTLCYLPPGAETIAIRCAAPTRLLLIGGEPMNENVRLWWNFVARTQEELQTAVSDWNAGRNFGTVPGAQLAPLRAPEIQGLHLKT